MCWIMKGSCLSFHSALLVSIMLDVSSSGQEGWAASCNLAKVLQRDIA